MITDSVLKTHSSRWELVQDSLSSLFPKEKVVSSWVQLSAFGADSSKEIAQRLSWEHFHLLPLFNLQSFEKVFLSNLVWKNCFDEIVFLAIILEVQIWCIYSQQLWMLSKVDHTRYQQMICWPQIPADQVAKSTKYPDERFTRDNIVVCQSVFKLCHHQIVANLVENFNFILIFNVVNDAGVKDRIYITSS